VPWESMESLCTLTEHIQLTGVAITVFILSEIRSHNLEQSVSNFDFGEVNDQEVTQRSLIRREET
jgi:hypothetical protein